MSGGGKAFLIFMVVAFTLCGVVAGSVLVLEKTGFLVDLENNNSTVVSTTHIKSEEYGMQCSECGKIVGANDECMHEVYKMVDCPAVESCADCHGTGLGEFVEDIDKVGASCVDCFGTGKKLHDWEFVETTTTYRMIYSCKVCGATYEIGQYSGIIYSGDKDGYCSADCERCHSTGKVDVPNHNHSLAVCSDCGGSGHALGVHHWEKFEELKYEGVVVYQCSACGEFLTISSTETIKNDGECEKNIVPCKVCNTCGYLFVGENDDGYKDCETCEAGKLANYHVWDFYDIIPEDECEWYKCIYCGEDYFLSLEDVNDKLPEKEVCPKHFTYCSDCNGVGAVYVGDMGGYYADCKICNGTGKVVCSKCRGLGYVVKHVIENCATQKIYKCEKCGEYVIDFSQTCSESVAIVNEEKKKGNNK